MQWGNRLALALSALALTGACNEEDDRPPTFTYVYDSVIGPNCSTIGCHNTFTQTYGLPFNTKEGAYALLTGRACDGDVEVKDEASHNYVLPGQPDRSMLTYLLRGDDVPRRMPPDRAIPEADIELVEAWILEGAKCD